MFSRVPQARKRTEGDGSLTLFFRWAHGAWRNSGCGGCPEDCLTDLHPTLARHRFSEECGAGCVRESSHTLSPRDQGPLDHHFGRFPGFCYLGSLGVEEQGQEEPTAEVSWFLGSSRWEMQAPRTLGTV